MRVSCKQLFVDVSDALKASSKRLSHFYYAYFDFVSISCSNPVLVTDKGNKSKVIEMVHDYRNLITQFYEAREKYSSSLFSDKEFMRLITKDIETMIEEDKKLLFFLERYPITER